MEGLEEPEHRHRLARDDKREREREEMQSQEYQSVIVVQKNINQL